jgi:hypothetical protein
MDELAGALDIMSQKFRIDLQDLGNDFVFYIRVKAIMMLIFYLITAYVLYRLINYCYERFVEGYPAEPEGGAKLTRSQKELRGSIHAGLKATRSIAVTISILLCLSAAAFKISDIASPEGAALEYVLDTMREPVRVEVANTERKMAQFQREIEQQKRETEQRIHRMEQEAERKRRELERRIDAR